MYLEYHSDTLSSSHSSVQHHKQRTTILACTQFGANTDRCTWCYLIFQEVPTCDSSRTEVFTQDHKQQRNQEIILNTVTYMLNKLMT